MSLINKMLKDLDARGGHGHTPVTAEMHAVEESEGPNRVLITVVGVVAVSLAVGGVVGWRYYQKKAAQPTVQAKLAEGRVKPVVAATPAPAVLAPAGTVDPAIASAPQGPVVAGEREVKAMAGKPVQSTDAVAVQVKRETAGVQPAPVKVAPSSSTATARELGGASGGTAGNSPPNAGNAGAHTLPAAQKPVQRTETKRLEEERARVKAARAKAAAKAPVAAGAPLAASTDLAADRLKAGETAYRRALAQLSEGRVSDAMGVLEQALTLNPRHEAARQTLIGLYIEGRRGDDAMRHLQAALSLDPRQPDLAMLLARLQIERGGNGIDTLQRTLPAAATQADYLAFLGGALERAGRHREAAEQYQAALRLKPHNGVWWLGLGMALQGDQRPADAAEAYRRAQASGNLSADLHTFVERRLQQIGR